MILWFCDWLSSADPDTLTLTKLSVLRPTLFRAAVAAVAGLWLTFLCGPRAIAWLRQRFPEPQKSASATLDRLHAGKESTPTMGGLFLLAGLLAVTLLAADLTNRYVWLSLGVWLALAAVGAVDDLAKLRTSARGLDWRWKLSLQTLVALLAGICVAMWQSDQAADAAWWPGRSSLLATTLLAVLTIVGASNAVNVTDGLDGLAGGCALVALVVMGLALVQAGHPDSLEALVTIGGVVGLLAGFLRYNRFPARVFMGNTGALPLGGALGLLAVIAGRELLLIVAGGVFVAEAASSLLQILCYRLTGKRLLLCAPLHHHFEFRGWHESTIVRRFWMASVVCGLAAAVSLAGHARVRHAALDRAQSAETAAAVRPVQR